MKRKFLMLAIFVGIFIVFGAFDVIAQSTCDLNVKMINQDPYPAVPGDYVKTVFQVTGVGNSDCGRVTFEVVEEFPFTLEPGTINRREIISSTFSSPQFPSFWLVPYRLIVDEAALDGENEMRVQYITKNSATKIGKFNITVENLLTDFEISIKDYDKTTDILTFEILNIGESDIEALTVIIPRQDNIQVKGSNREIIGSLDSNEDTTFTFESSPKAGEIDVMILYTDEINVRRELSKSVVFDPIYFEDRKNDGNGRSVSFYLLIVLVVVIVIYFYVKKRRSKKKARSHS
jgi:hypothetical protein